MDEVRRWIPYCGEAPAPDVWLTRWNLDPVLGLAMLLAAFALWHPRFAVRAAAGSAGTEPHRRQALHAAWALVFVLYVSPLCALSSAFFSVRVLHHMLLVLAVAPLLAIGLERTLRRMPAPLWPCTAAAALLFWLWHAPGPYAAALSSALAYAAMQLSLAASATAFWLAVRRAAPPQALAAILATTVQMGLLGALITFSTRPLYAPHVVSSLAWGVAPLDDQQLAGLIMWAPGSIAYLAAAMAVGWSWLDRARAVGARAA